MIDLSAVDRLSEGTHGVCGTCICSGVDAGAVKSTTFCCPQSSMDAFDFTAAEDVFLGVDGDSEFWRCRLLGGDGDCGFLPSRLLGVGNAIVSTQQINRQSRFDAVQ